MDLLPSGQSKDQSSSPSLNSQESSDVGHVMAAESCSEHQLSVSPDMASDMAFVAPPAPRLLLEDKIDEPSNYMGEPSTSKMDTGQPVYLYLYLLFLYPLLNVHCTTAQKYIMINYVLHMVMYSICICI